MTEGKDQQEPKHWNEVMCWDVPPRCRWLKTTNFSDIDGRHWLMSWGWACQRVRGDCSFTCRTEPAQREGAKWIHPLWDPTTCRRCSRGPLCYRCLGANWLQGKPCLGRGKSWQLWLDCCPWIWISKWKGIWIRQRDGWIKAQKS